MSPLVVTLRVRQGRPSWGAFPAAGLIAASKGRSLDASGVMVWVLEATFFPQARQLWDEAAKGDTEGGV